MAPELLATLGVLALVDSLSIGTLLIPVFFLIAPGRVRAVRMLGYLGTIAVFYFLLGLALAGGAGVLLTDAAAVFELPGVRVAQLVIGAGLLVWSFFIGGKKQETLPRADAASAPPTAVPEPVERAQAGPWGPRVDAEWMPRVDAGPRPDSAAHGEAGRAGERRGASVHRHPHPANGGAPANGGGRLARWRDRAMGDGPASTVVVLALAAGLIEAATMLPYLGAVGIITASGADAATAALVLAGYCAVMIAPALVLLALRIVARPLVEPALRRLADWLQRNAAENTAWIVGIAGFLIARDAWVALGLEVLGIRFG
ncbi:GAP family protein [Agromyces archimandritae]|uniref:GAP family protein n=1 Tax=Agromyces archimandritae TaxID=2781962 RepID=A0A975FKB9_9MICO|nr:GAP family protein [Agromyces archimandritae]QTX03640.1 GAP family protein [Agromyces archimandritae]